MHFYDPWLCNLFVVVEKWHTPPCKFKVYSVIVWFTHSVKWVSQQLWVRYIISYRYNEMKRNTSFLVMRTLRTDFLNTFLRHPTAWLAIVLMLYIVSLVLTFLIILICTFDHLPSIPPPLPMLPYDYRRNSYFLLL